MVQPAHAILRAADHRDGNEEGLRLGTSSTMPALIGDGHGAADAVRQLLCT